MKETTAQILLAEYDHLKEVEQFWLQSYERALQLYLTVITAAAGVLLLLVERQVAPSVLPQIVGLLIGIVLVIGEITFLRLMGIDIRLTENAKGYLLIRDRFVSADPELANVFLKGLVQDMKRYRSWSSIRGIFSRTFTVSQQKTTVVLLNCLVAVGIVVVLMWSATLWISLVVGIGVAIIVGFLHVVYASWRYKKTDRLLSTGEVGHWI